MMHDVDERLLFFPFFERLCRRNNPKTASLLTNEEARSAFLRAIEASGNAQRVTSADGCVRLAQVAAREWCSSVSHRSTH